MQKVLSWLYTTLQPLYKNPTVTYQDVSLVLSVFTDLKIRTEIYNNQLLLKIYTDNTNNTSSGTIQLLPANTDFSVSIYLLTDYPQSAPIIRFFPLNPQTHTLLQNSFLASNGELLHPFLEAWPIYNANRTSNDGISPRENRLLVLIYTLHKLIEENPTIWIAKIPSLPPKPSISLSVLEAKQSELSLLEKKELDNSSPLPPSLPPLPQSKVKSSITNHSTHSEHTSKSPPQLPPNPIRQNLLRDTSIELNKTLISILNGISDYSPIPNLNIVIENQNKLIKCLNNFSCIENSISDIDSVININTPIIDSKCSEAKLLINNVNNFVNSNYHNNGDNNENLLILENEKAKQLSDLCFQEASYLDSLHFLELLFNTQKITFTDYIENIRKISRERAKLLIWINKFK